MRGSIPPVLAGLAASAPTLASAQAAEPVPCSVPVESASREPWQQITARGFTFCIPSSWRAGSRNTFRGDGGWVRWGTGAYRGGPRETGTAIIAVPANEVPNLVPTPRGRYNHFPETIGGSVAELWDSELDGKSIRARSGRDPRESTWRASPPTRGCGASSSRSTAR